MVTLEDLLNNSVPIVCIIVILVMVLASFMDWVAAQNVFIVVCVFLVVTIAAPVFSRVNWEVVFFTIVLVLGVWYGLVVRNYGSNQIYSIIFLSMSGLIFFIVSTAILSQSFKREGLGGLNKFLKLNAAVYYSMYLLFGWMIFTVLLLSFVTGTAVPGTGLPVLSGEWQLIILSFYTLMGFAYFMNRIKLLQSDKLFINKLKWEQKKFTFYNFLLSPAYFVFEVFYLFGSVFNFRSNVEKYDDRDSEGKFVEQKDCSLTNAKRIGFSLGSYDTGKGANIEFNDSRFIYSFIFITVLISWPLLLCLRNKEKIFAKEDEKITGFSTFFLDNLAYASCYLLLFTVPLVFGTVTPVAVLETEETKEN